MYNETKQKVKDHLERHKLLYSCVSTGVVFAGITVVIMRNQYSLGGRVSTTKEWGGRYSTTKPQVNIGSNFSGNGNSIGNDVTNNYDIKPLSYITKLDGTDRWWMSQADVSRETGIAESELSKHINHGKELASGLNFTRLGIAS